MALPLPRHRYQTVRTARTSLSLTTQAFLITAIPLALWHLSGNPLPTTIPTWTQISEDYAGLLQQPTQITGYALRLGADTLWITWAWYTLWFTLALAWVLLHLPHAQLPRHLAAITPTIAVRALSLGVLIVVPTLVPRASPAAPPQTSPNPAQLTATVRTLPTPATALPTETVHVVRPGENLWDIAHTAYGDPTRWRLIYHANKDVIQADGRSLHNPDLILPGWRLTIPATSIPAPTPAAAPSTGTTPPTDPTTSTPSPVRTPPPSPRTAATGAPGRVTPVRTDRPHTVGYVLPGDAGYIGITLITAIAAAVALLRTRNRHHHRPSNQDIPDLAQHLAAVHSAAQSAAYYTYQPDEHPAQQPPPLTTQPTGHPDLGTSPDQQHETPFNTDQLPGPLVLTGPGAHGAARALSISTLVTEGHTLHTDPNLTNDLLGATEVPGWLETTASTDPPPHSIAVHVPEPGTHYPPGTGLLGEPDDTSNATILHVEHDGTQHSATGPAADQYEGTRLHTLSQDAATQLYHTLHTARPTPPTNTLTDTTETIAPIRQNETRNTADQASAARALTALPLILRILGEPDVLNPDGYPSSLSTDQATALLTLLALHPDGIRAHTLRTLEWPHGTDDHRTRLALATAINRTRTLLRAIPGQTPDTGEHIIYDKTRQTYRLNPDLITTDLTLARTLTAQANETTRPDEQLRHLTQATALHRGELASHLDDNHRDWLTTTRYDTLTQAVELNLRAAILAANASPTTAASYAQHAATLAPHDAQTVSRALQIATSLSSPELGSTIYHLHTRALRELRETPADEVVRLFEESQEPAR